MMVLGLLMNGWNIKVTFLVSKNLRFVTGKDFTILHPTKQQFGVTAASNQKMRIPLGASDYIQVASVLQQIGKSTFTQG